MREEIKNEIWKKIKDFVHKYEITCGEDIYQASRLQDSTADILYAVLEPLLDILEKIDIEEVEDNNFDIDKLIQK